MRTLAAPFLLAVIASVTAWRIAATHHVFSPTWDEPAHIYAGYEYLADHRYAFDKSHPPLARIIFAFPLRDAKPSATDVHERIGDILSSHGDYMSGLVAARRGNLLFLVIALFGIVLWTADLYGTRIAVIAAALFVLLPPILAHAGLATTDLPVTAAFAAAMAVFGRWIRSPDWRHTVCLSVVLGAGLVTKFSFAIFVGIAAVTMMAARRRWPVWQGMLAAVGALVIVWGVYWFHQLPRFFTGFAAVMKHDTAGHAAYFLGEVRTTGWWEYFPIILGIKTPIPFLVLVAVGTAFVLRERRNRFIPVIFNALESRVRSRSTATTERRAGTP